ncbi:MAG: hypothetical protein RL653_1029 [Pseudomonadota bacterium]
MGERLGRYQLERKLGSGGMAEVWLARAEGPGGFSRQVVLKRIHVHLLEEPRFVEMFLGEASLVARLSHPNIVQLFDFGEDGGTPYLAMEWMDGPSVKGLMQKARASGRAIPLPLCARIAALASEGLGYAHTAKDPETGLPLQLVHRDVSPDNLLLSRSGAVKVADFGIARSAVQKHRTKTGTVKGKLAYMSPEQLRAEPLDGRADQYALGVVLYELLTGHRPFDTKGTAELMRAIVQSPIVPVRTRRPEVPEALAAITERALSKDREARFTDCREMQRALEAWLVRGGHAVSAWDLSQWMETDAGGPGEVTRELESSDETTPVPGAASVESAPTAHAGGRPWVGLAFAAVALAAVGVAALLQQEVPSASPPSAAAPAQPAAVRSPAGPPPDRALPVDAGAAGPARAEPVGGPPGESAAAELFAAAQRAERAREWSVAKELALRCASEFTAFSGCRLLLGRARVREANSPEAAEEFRRYLALGGTTREQAAETTAWLEQYESVREGLARARAQLDAHVDDAAYQGFGACIQVAPSVPECHEGRARAALGLGENLQVAQSFRRYLELAPAGPTAAEAWRQLDRLASANAPAPRRASGPKREEADRAYERGKQALHDRSYAQALTAFQQCLRSDPGFAECHKGLGATYARTGEPEKGAEAYRAYLRLAPDAPDAARLRTMLMQFDQQHR